ncbi:MAG: hypothetical protein HZB40_17570 [Rhodocyclales bacterium]|nr:hypothetical protein [Rhodocyclales bacterium]
MKIVSMATGSRAYVPSAAAGRDGEKCVACFIRTSCREAVAISKVAAARRPCLVN